MKPICGNMDMTPELIRLDEITNWATPGSCQRLKMLRLDLIHPVVSGNKWFKLKYNIAAAQEAGKNHILSFGGGYSNHLVATAYAAKQFGFKSTGIVRGHYEGEHLSPSLKACMDFGMELILFDKAKYLQYSGRLCNELQDEYPDAWIVPEGGANEAGVKGAMEIADFIPQGTTHVCCAVGTGSTITGLGLALPKEISLNAFCAARSCEEAEQLWERSLGDKNTPASHQVLDLRFGKWTPELREFMLEFRLRTEIPLDIVYTGKMMQKVEQLLQNDYFGRDSRIVCLHTGGLQGNPPAFFED